MSQLGDVDPQYVIDMETIKEILLLEQEGNLTRGFTKLLRSKRKMHSQAYKTLRKRWIQIERTEEPLKEESYYIRKIKGELEPDFQYIHDLEMLRAIIRQSNRTGNYGSSGSWLNERYINLKEKYPEAVRAFETELEEEKEVQRLRKETKRQETLEKHRQSPYFREQIEQLSGSEEGERQLRELMRLRDMMIHAKQGYRGQAMGYLKANLRHKYPVAFKAFQQELG